MTPPIEIDADRDAEMAQRFFSQALELWVNPELERRRKAGRLMEGFELKRLQVVMIPPPNERNIVRLNDEVAPIAAYRFDGPVTKGQEIEVDPARIQGFRLAPDDDPNAGHLTMVRFGDRWVTHFDFTYNRERAQNHLQASREFLNAARSALRDGMVRPACDTLFAAIELAVKAEMLLSPRGETKRHREWLRRFTEWTRLGNAPAASQEVLSKLSHLRTAARYLQGELDIDPGTLEDYASKIESQITHVQSRLDFVIGADDKEN
ncbi:MAG: HEPN domain-containing protein [Dehalococcoidia bacterium]